MLDNPIRQGLLKSDITSGFFGLDPLVSEDFFPFRLKFTVKGRIFEQVTCRRLFSYWIRHIGKNSVPKLNPSDISCNRNLFTQLETVINGYQ